MLYYLDGYNETTTLFYRTQTNKNVDLGDAVVFWVRDGMLDEGEYAKVFINGLS